MGGETLTNNNNPDAAYEVTNVYILAVNKLSKT